MRKNFVYPLPSFDAKSFSQETLEKDFSIHPKERCAVVDEGADEQAVRCTLYPTVGYLSKIDADQGLCLKDVVKQYDWHLVYPAPVKRIVVENVSPDFVKDMKLMPFNLPFTYDDKKKRTASVSFETPKELDEFVYVNFGDNEKDLTSGTTFPVYLELDNGVKAGVILSRAVRIMLPFPTEAIATNLSLDGQMNFVRVDGASFPCASDINGTPVFTVNPYKTKKESKMFDYFPEGLDKKVLCTSKHVVEFLGYTVDQVARVQWKGFNVLRESMKNHRFANQFVW